MAACYFVQSFTLSPKQALLAELPLPVADREQACRLARRLSPQVSGIVVLERGIDRVTGEYGEPHILFDCGLIPDELQSLKAPQSALTARER